MVSLKGQQQRIRCSLSSRLRKFLLPSQVWFSIQLIVSAAWEFFVGSSAAAATVAEFAKLSKIAAGAGAIEGFYMRDMEDCFFAPVGILTLGSGFSEFLTLVSGYKGPSLAAAAAASPRVDVEKGPQAAAALDVLDESFQVTSRCLFQKHPDCKRKEEREERKIQEDEERDKVLLVRGLRENTMVVRCESGWTARDLSGSLHVRTAFLLICSTLWWRGA